MAAASIYFRIDKMCSAFERSASRHRAPGGIGRYLNKPTGVID